MERSHPRTGNSGNSPVALDSFMRASGYVRLPHLLALELAAKPPGGLQRDLPPESSQYSTFRPTKLDKIKNFYNILHPSGIVGYRSHQRKELPNPF